MKQDLPAIQLCHDLLADLLPRLGKFPKEYKFTLGNRISSDSLDVLEFLVDAAYSSDKAELLRSANARLARVRHLLRLARDLGPLSNKGYEHVMKLVVELGQQIGGWRKQAQKANG